MWVGHRCHLSVDCWLHAHFTHIALVLQYPLHIVVSTEIPKEPGFDLESTHLQHIARLSRLTLAVALLYSWLVEVGAKIIKNGLRHWVDRADRRDLSIFQIGFRSIDRRLTNALPINFQCSIGCSEQTVG